MLERGEAGNGTRHATQEEHAWAASGAAQSGAASAMNYGMAAKAGNELDDGELSDDAHGLFFDETQVEFVSQEVQNIRNVALQDRRILWGSGNISDTLLSNIGMKFLLYRAK